MSDPDEVTIIVHGAKGIQGKKPNRHKYSVIFGLGATKFRTAIEKNPTGNPDWNEETLVNVSNILDQVFFIVTEKDDILGQISIPVTSLSGTAGQKKKMALQPHKKCPSPQGELVYQCFVSKYRSPGDHLPVIKNLSQAPNEVRPHSAFQRLKKRMASPVTHRRMKPGDNNKDKGDKKENRKSLGGFNKRLSRSIQDLFSFGKLSAGETVDIDDNESVSSSTKNGSIGKSGAKKTKRKFSLSFLSVSDNLDQAGKDPIITSVTPNCGPCDQPVRLTIEGRNLGTGKSDILALKIAGCDCTDTLEFDSSMRIYCTTHFWKACRGPVEIDTISGGIGLLKDGYTFYEELDANDNKSKNPFDVDDDEAADTVADDGEHVDFKIGGKEITSGSNTLPRIKGTATDKKVVDKPPVGSNATPNAPGRYQKRHARSHSESVVVMETPIPSVAHISKEELQAKIVKLEEENAGLKKDNVQMKSYIDKLVAKCMIHCPAALAQDDDEKSKLFVL